MRKHTSLARAASALTVLLGLSMLAAPAPTAHAEDTGTTLTTLYDAQGTSTIGSIGSSLPIGPTVLTETLDIPTSNIIDGTLPIPSQQVQFNALGFIPIRATVSLVQVGPITGTLRPGTVPRSNAVTANVHYTIRLSNVKALIFGIWTPMFVGDNCRTAAPVDITVKTPDGQTFNVFSGGPVAGTYTIGDFTGCSAFFIPGVGSLAINAMVPGSNNTIALQLSNGRYPA
ncbi:hypothetical protein [Nocardioides sp. SLBN-35]|uniref:hypothetical protein n=1 Tax=Nocardioides sp. SLBN-35 TaxID=2768445 RepID=UPI00114F37FD|nr:hypothetical protein [Nocardioides sp. SLBN-35]TQK69700.1 hypothetical protein FBY23_1466 [Nocardioides sp. SLBN-35]